MEISRPPRILIKARYIVGIRHGGTRMLENDVLVLEGDRVVFVGKNYDGLVDRTFEAPDHLVSPGFICTNFHTPAPLLRDYFADHGKRRSYMDSRPPTETSGIQNVAARVNTRYSAVEAIECGTTTVIDLFLSSEERETTLWTYGEMVLRAYLISQHKSATWQLREVARLGYCWEEAAKEQLQHSLDFIGAFDGTYEGRISCMLGPVRIDTCSSQLLCRARAEAERLGAGIEIVGLQSVDEFREIVARHGVTPFELLGPLGLLGQDLIGHAVFAAGHSWTLFPPGCDLELLAETGTPVAHSVTVFARSDIALESFGHYRAAGVNVTMGMDICLPQHVRAHARRKHGVQGRRPECRNGGPRCLRRRNAEAAFHRSPPGAFSARALSLRAGGLVNPKPLSPLGQPPLSSVSNIRSA